MTRGTRMIPEFSALIWELDCLVWKQDVVGFFFVQEQLSDIVTCFAPGAGGNDAKHLC